MRPIYIALFLLACGAYWFMAVFPGVQASLNYTVPHFPVTLGVLENNPNAYLWLNFVSVVFPFLLSFDRRVAFYKTWPKLFPAIAITGVFFLVWDIYFAQIGVWGFNPRYANYFFWGLPLGEWLFFLVVPYCCLFVYECLNYYIKDHLKPFEKGLDWFFTGTFLAVGFLNIDRAYTSTAFLLSGALMLAHLFVWRSQYRSRLYMAYFVCCIPFVLVNGVLTGGCTEQPVVLYTDAENLSSLLGFRLVSIPFDDFAYNFLLFGMTVTWFEMLMARAKRSI